MSLKNIACVSPVQLILLVLIISISSCTRQEKKEIIINKDSFGDYPAIILDLKNNSLMKINNGFRDLAQIKGDLWIESNDPEIAGLENSFEGIKHIGKNVLLRILDDNLSDKEIKALDLNTYQGKIDRSKIKSGLIFIVKASDNSYYKIEIVSFSRSEAEIELKYQKIE